MARENLLVYEVTLKYRGEQYGIKPWVLARDASGAIAKGKRWAKRETSQRLRIDSVRSLGSIDLA